PKLAWLATFPCPAAMGDRPRFASTSQQQLGEPRRFIAGYQERLATNGDRRRSAANSDCQAFDTIGGRQELATDCQLQRRATPGHGKHFADAGHHQVVAVTETGHRLRWSYQWYRRRRGHSPAAAD